MHCCIYFVYIFLSGKTLAHGELQFMSSHRHLNPHAAAPRYSSETVLLLKAQRKREAEICLKEGKKGMWRQIQDETKTTWY